NLSPFDNNNKFLKGNTHKLSSGELKDMARNCGAHVLVLGKPEDCRILPTDPKINDYFKTNFPEFNFDNTLHQDISKMSCLLKFYLLKMASNGANHIQTANSCLGIVDKSPDAQ